jgi:hypothetical protein
MKQKHVLIRLLILSLFSALAPAALAANTWYVDGIKGNDTNDCLSLQSACQTIGHAISLARWGDSIMVAPATYTENLIIKRSLKIVGSDAATTIVDGSQAGTVITIPTAKAHVQLSKLTIRNGLASHWGGGIYNSGTLTINQSTVSGNSADDGWGGGIINYQHATLTINKSTITGNSAGYLYGEGGGIMNVGTVTINKSTITGNSARYGGGCYNYYSAALTINNSTISANSAGYDGGGGIVNQGGTVTINNSTSSGNGAYDGASIDNTYDGTVALQNSIVANSLPGGNCAGLISSNGYNLSSDDTCNFTGPGDMNKTDPKLGRLKDNGGPTQTMRLLEGSPAIDAGNPAGCTDDKGKLLETDQRGWLRPDKQSGRCDIGAFEKQKK